MARVLRYAPSPTGQLHLGGLRTALYNLLAAKNPPSERLQKRPEARSSREPDVGTFLLRIEDTDQKRQVAGAAEALGNTLKWAGLTWDKVPESSPLGRALSASSGRSAAALGVRDDGVVVQSLRVRSGVYARAAESLLERGAAYRCFCTEERLSQFRGAAGRKGAPAVYDRLCASLSQAQVDDRLARGEPFVVRLFVPPGTTSFVDLVRGRSEFRHDHIDDQVLLKSDGFPTYHLANVVDDHDCGVTHVVRGEEWVASTPKHLLLYDALGWSSETPEFAHLPLLANADGSKLSKRQGDMSVEAYRDAGFLPAALLNYVTMLGWTPPAEREVYFDPVREIPRDFELGRVHRNAAVVSIDKLRWFNAQHLRHMARDGSDSTQISHLVSDLRRELELASLLQVSAKGDSSAHAAEIGSDAYLEAVLRCIKDRISLIRDIPTLCSYFWVDPVPEKAASPASRRSFEKLWRAGDAARVRDFAQEALAPLADSGGWTAEEINDVARAWCKKDGTKLPLLWKPLRFAVTGTDVGAGVPQTLATLGPEPVLRRIYAATAVLE